MTEKQKTTVEQWLIRLATTIVTLVVPFAVIILMQSLGEIKSEMAHLGSEVQQIDQLDSIKQRLTLLEVRKNILSHLQASTTKTIYPPEGGAFLQMDVVDSMNGDALEFDPRRDATKIRMLKDGTLFFVVAPQFRRAPNYEGEACLLVWLVVSGKDLANSSIKSCLGEGDPWTDTSTAILQAVLPLHANDTVQVKMRASPDRTIGAVAIRPTVVGDAPEPPLVPAAITSALVLD